MGDDAFSDDELIAMLDAQEREKCVVISNPALPDNPMIYVGEEFESHTGYTPEEALGRNCRFLQGPDTNPDAIAAIQHALRARTTFTIDILNYKKSGEPFMNRLRIRPLLDDGGEFMYFVGVQNPL